MDSQRKGTSPLFYTPFDPSSPPRFRELKRNLRPAQFRRPGAGDVAELRAGVAVSMSNAGFWGLEYRPRDDDEYDPQ